MLLGIRLGIGNQGMCGVPVRHVHYMAGGLASASWLSVSRWSGDYKRGGADD